MRLDLGERCALQAELEMGHTATRKDEQPQQQQKCNSHPIRTMKTKHSKCTLVNEANIAT